MKNCLISGFGRSGTSLMGGILYNSGYYMGDNLYTARDTNPKGFFENDFINSINEKILQKFDYCNINKSYPSFNKIYSPFKPGIGHRWLSYISPLVKIENINTEVFEDIEKAVSYKKFAYKDPRFNFTIPIWDQLLPQDTVIICIFRDPGTTINSIITECKRSKYLAEFYIDQQLAELLWSNSYTHLLNAIGKTSKKYIFVHYEQLLNGKKIEEISDLLQVILLKDFISKELNRSKPIEVTRDYTLLLYKKLCTLANY
ncbi:MAG: sulfotransferase [Prolixibacteraceae bacterium]|nr:sulfotransferase [Prolixibacteraceae bacterium]